MNGKQVLITGAASGVGLGLAQRMAAAGARIVAADLDRVALEQAVAPLRQSGASLAMEALDVSDQAAVDALARRHGIDVLINNAGIQRVARLEDFDPAQWRRMIDIMLCAPAMLTRALLPGMRERGYGRIINIGSIHSLVASPFKSAYVAAKHGLLGLSKTVALETADVDITINTICPSYVMTPLVQRQIAAQAAEHGISEDEVIERIMLRPMPKRQFISIDEIAGIAEFLAGAAARNISGQTLVVDGGWTAQ